VQPGPQSHLRLARPCRDLAAVERFWVVAGGTRVTARNPYWETWGTTVQDPDGYRLVLSHRSWETNQRPPADEHLR
jgi:hypothetical protein